MFTGVSLQRHSENRMAVHRFSEAVGGSPGFPVRHKYSLCAKKDVTFWADSDPPITATNSRSMPSTLRLLEMFFIRFFTSPIPSSRADPTRRLSSTCDHLVNSTPSESDAGLYLNTFF